jgi:phosphate:Na+ symporter
MSPVLIAATFFAGLAFFFLGLGMVKAGLQAVANRRFRKIAATLVAGNPLAAVWGVVLGAITQSATAVAFLLVGLVSAGLLPLTRSLVAVSWANVGTTALVFIAAIDVRLVALFLVAISGLVIGLGHRGRWEPVMRAALGVGLLFLGLGFMRDAIHPLIANEGFRTIADFFNRYLPVGFLAGALLRLAIQSSSGIIIVLMTLAAQGVLSPAQALMCVHGTGVGVGLTVLLLGSNLTGATRQTAMYQALINTAAALLLALWVGLSEAKLVPGLLALLDRLAHGNAATALACGFGLQMLLCAVIGSLLVPGAPAWLARLAPPSREQTLARPKFLDENALATAEVALLLVEQEQKRVIATLPHFLDGIRSDRTPVHDGLGPTTLRQALHTLNGEITNYLADLMTHETGREARQRVLTSTYRQQCLNQLADALADFALTTGPLRRDPHAGCLVTSLIEGLDTIISVATDAAQSGDPLDSQMLATMTSDRGDLLDSMRHSVVHRPDSGATDSARGESALLYALSLFERTVWLVRQLRL